MHVELDDIFSPGGILDNSLDHYEFRPSQKKMAESVLQAIQDRDHLCAEAGTGTGKTLAYLVPSLSVEGRVVVSTATRNLQEQLVNKDIPLIKDCILPSLQAVCMKGRSNYLCLHRLERLTRQGSLFTSDPVSSSLEKLKDWSESTEEGDRSELDWLSDASEIWEMVDARSETCLGSKCRHFEDCFITRLRLKAVSADIIIVNHALFFTSLSLATDESGGLLPESSVVVLDEAHEVEDIASGLFGRRISSHQLESLSRDIVAVSSPGSDLVKMAERLVRAGHGLDSALPSQSGRVSLNLYREKDRSLSDLRRTHFGEFSAVESCLSEVYHALEARIGESLDHELLARRADNLLAVADDILNTDDEDSVYWFERSKKGVSLNLTPVNVSPYLRSRLFDSADTVVLTSATMKTGGSFEFFKKRLGLDESLEVDLPGEFDYSSQARLFIPRDLPENPGDGNLNPQVGYIRRILSLADGHAFLLFTSFRQMKKVHEILKEEGDYPPFTPGGAAEIRHSGQFSENSPLCSLRYQQLLAGC